MLRGVDHAQPRPSLRSFAPFRRCAARVPWLPLGRFPTRGRARSKGWCPRRSSCGSSATTRAAPSTAATRCASSSSCSARRARAARGGWSRSAASARTTCWRPPSTAGRPASRVDAVVFPQPLTDARARADAGRRRRRRDAASYRRLPRRAARRCGGARRGGDAAWIAAGGSSADRLARLRLGGARAARADRARRAAAARRHLRRARIVRHRRRAARRPRAARRRCRGSMRASSRCASSIASSSQRAGRRGALAARTAGALAARGEHWFDHSRRRRSRVEHRFFGGAYGRATPAADDAVRARRRRGLHARADLHRQGDGGAARRRRGRPRSTASACCSCNTYSRVDLAPLVAGGPGVDALPPALQRYFDAGARPAG